ncbi:MAG: response regulator transcription factor [Acetobacteraceae bacterium]
MTDPKDAPATVHVVDDDAGVRDSLRLLLEMAGFTVRTHANAAALLAAAVREAVGCVLSDVRMPEIDGLELQRRLNQSGINLPVILMTAHGGVHTAVSGMKAGAVDFLEKPFGEDQLFSAVRRALERSRRHQARRSVTAESTGKLAALTARERDVLELLVAGLSSKAIARTLHISPRTVDVHRARVFEKLHAENLPALVRLVMAAEPQSDADDG